MEGSWGVSAPQLGWPLTLISAHVGDDGDEDVSRGKPSSWLMQLTKPIGSFLATFNAGFTYVRNVWSLHIFFFFSP